MLTLEFFSKKFVTRGGEMRIANVQTTDLEGASQRIHTNTHEVVVVQSEPEISPGDRITILCVDYPVAFHAMKALDVVGTPVQLVNGITIMEVKAKKKGKRKNAKRVAKAIDRYTSNIKGL